MSEITPVATMALAGDERADGSAQLWKYVSDALRDLQFGTVTLIVQDGLVIQVDRTEKRRLPRRGEKR
jgi:hypothetical protein